MELDKSVLEKARDFLDILDVESRMVGETLAISRDSMMESAAAGKTEDESYEEMIDVLRTLFYTTHKVFCTNRTDDELFVGFYRIIDPRPVA